MNFNMTRNYVRTEGEGYTTRVVYTTNYSNKELRMPLSDWNQYKVYRRLVAYIDAANTSTAEDDKQNLLWLLDEVYDDGYEEGHTDGYEEGYEEGARES